MDWDDDSPKGITVTTWDDIAASGTNTEVPAVDKETKPRPLGLFCAVASGEFELVEFTSEVSLSYIFSTGLLEY